jgi:DNA ligase (NAD+)
VPAPPDWVDPEAAPASARIDELRREIARHDALYFKQNTLEISDAAYDGLKQELRQLEQSLGQLPASAEDSESVIGDDRSDEFPLVSHQQPMLSLEKAYTESELRAFITRVAQRTGRSDLRWVVEPKFDGLAISVTYENGHLLRAVTRGDGHQGDDVTANVRTIPELAVTLPSTFPRSVELRGEVYLDYAEFNRLNQERDDAGETPFTHPRNLAAGTLKLHTPAEVARRRLRIVFYGLGAWDGLPLPPTSQQALHARIRDWKLPGVESVTTAQTSNEVWTAVTQLGRHRAALSFPTDGAVIKLDDVALQHELGDSAKAPRWSIAYKYPPSRISTRLQQITLQVGRTGIITPLAELEPVVIGGTTVARASLYNAEVIARRDLRIGDWVFVEKAGGIIPVVVGPDVRRRTAALAPYPFPQTCPECAGKLVRNEGEATTRCVQSDCPGQLRRRIEHYVSPDAADIKGMGPVLIAALVNGHCLKTVADLYRLRTADLVYTGGVSERVGRQLIEQIEQSKKTRLGRLIYGLSIPGVGRAAAAEWAAGLENLPQWQATTPAPAQTYLSQVQNRALITDLIAFGVCPKTAGNASSKGPLFGKTVVLTGTLPSWNRAEARQQIEAVGGHVANAVSRRTHLVVAGENPGSKLNEAQSLGLEIITESELKKRLTP